MHHGILSTHLLAEKNEDKGSDRSEKNTREKPTETTSVLPLGEARINQRERSPANGELLCMWDDMYGRIHICRTLKMSHECRWRDLLRPQEA